MYMYIQYIHMNMNNTYNTYVSITYYTYVHTQKQGYVFLRAHHKCIPKSTPLPASISKAHTPPLSTVTSTPTILHCDILHHLALWLPIACPPYCDRQLLLPVLCLWSLTLPCMTSIPLLSARDTQLLLWRPAFPLHTRTPFPPLSMATDNLASHLHSKIQIP